MKTPRRDQVSPSTRSSLVTALAVLVGALTGLSSAGAFAQSNDGSFSYGYDFQLPRARGRYQPSLGLTYSSQGGSTGFGVGWSLPLSKIEVSSRASPIDSTGALGRNGIPFGQNPRSQIWLSLGGRHLLVCYPQPPTGQPCAGTYRPDVAASFLQAQWQSPSSSWIVTDGVGTTFTFSRISGEGSDGGKPLGFYFLTLVSDVDGNASTYTYQADTQGVRLTGINYNFASNSAGTSVVLEYLDPDLDPNSGVHVFTGTTLPLYSAARMLSDVKISHIGAIGGTPRVTSGYGLHYTTSLSGQKLLQRVEVLGLDFTQPSSINPTIFRYGAQPNYSFGAAATLSPPSTGLPSAAGATVAWIDLNGDHLPDMVWTAYDGLHWARNTTSSSSPLGPRVISFAAATVISNTSAWGGTIDFRDSSGSSRGTRSGTPQTRIMDMNGDGLPDLVSINTSCPSPSLGVQFAQPSSSAGVAYGSMVCIDASWVLADWNLTTRSAPFALNYVTNTSEVGDGISTTHADLLDMNGDGLPDYVLENTFNNDWFVHHLVLQTDAMGNVLAGAFSSGVEYHSTNAAPAGSGAPIRVQDMSGVSGTTTELVDMNGDGLPDAVNADASGNWTISYNLGIVAPTIGDFATSTAVGAWAVGGPIGNTVNSAAAILMDLNHDGRPDLVSRNSTNGGWSVRLNSGASFQPAYNVTLPGQGATCPQCSTAASAYLPFSIVTATIEIPDPPPPPQNPPIQYPTVYTGYNGLFIDLDGDGTLDYVVWDSSGAWFWYPGNAGATPADILTGIDTPAGSTETISYAASSNFGTAPYFPITQVVTSIVTTGVGLPSGISSSISYAFPQVTRGWDEPTRLEPLGFSVSSATVAGGSTRTTTWGGTHATAGVAIEVDVANGSTVYQRQTDQYATRVLTQAATSQACAIQTAGVVSVYPAIIYDSVSASSHIEAGIAFTSESFVGPNATGPNCSSVDDYGNITSRISIPDMAIIDPSTNFYRDAIQVTATFSSALASAATACKSCVMTSITSSNGIVVAQQAFVYDAPLGQFDPSDSTVVTKGHLNYVKQMVSKDAQGNAVWEVAQKASHTALGNIAQTRADYSGQCLTMKLTTFDYDPFELTATKETTSDDAGSVLSVERVLDATTGWLLSQTSPHRSGDAVVPQTTYAYDAYGRTVALGRGASGSTVTDAVAAFWYQPADRYLSAPAARVLYAFASAYALDSNAWLANTSVPPAPPGATVTYSYSDAFGREIQRRSNLGMTSIPGDAQIVSPSLSGILVTGSVLYDSLGHATAAFDPYNSSTGTSYVSPTIEIPQATRVSTAFYDPQGRPTCKMYRAQAKGLIVSSDSPGVCVSNFSDTSDYQLATLIRYGTGTGIGASSSVSLMSVGVIASSVNTDSLGRPMSSALADASGRAWYSFTASGDETEFLQNLTGRTKTVNRYAGTGGTAGVVSTSSFDYRGRVISMVDDGRVKSYTYLPTGQMAQVVQAASGLATDANAVVVTSLFGSQGRLVRKIDQQMLSGSLATTGYSKFGYDAPFSGSASYAYTSGATSWAESCDSASCGATPTTRIAFGYDRDGHQVRRDEWFGDAPSVEHTVQHAFRNDGAAITTTLSSQTLPNNGVVSYSRFYDSFGRLEQVSGATTGSTGTAGTTTYWAAGSGYDQYGRLTQALLDSGNVATSSTFSSNSGQVTAYSSKRMVGTQWSAVLDAASMTYQGNLLTGYTEGVAGDQYSFTYDAQRRLQHATARSWGTAATEYVANLQQTYDQTFSFCSGSNAWATAPTACSGLGTLTGMRSSNPNAPDVIYHYGQGEQLSVISGGGVASNNVSYDSSDRGLIASVDGNQSVSSSYDAENRLTSTGPSGQSDSLSYDALGALAIRRVSGGSTYYYVGDHITVMVEGTVTTARAEILAGTRIASAWYEAGTTALSQTTMYYQVDRLGSVVATTVTGGVLKATYRYDPYGIVTGSNNDTGHFASDLGYTGGRRLSGGPIHLGARTYNPVLRQFMQADNIDYLRYAYAAGDPINGRDPSGHQTVYWNNSDYTHKWQAGPVESDLWSVQNGPQMGAGGDDWAGIAMSVGGYSTTDKENPHPIERPAPGVNVVYNEDLGIVAITIQRHYVDADGQEITDGAITNVLDDKIQSEWQGQFEGTTLSMTIEYGDALTIKVGGNGGTRAGKTNNDTGVIELYAGLGFGSDIDYQANTLMHELGHALGLDHVFGADRSVLYANSVDSNGRPDVMSYFRDTRAVSVYTLDRLVFAWGYTSYNEYWRK